MVSISVTQGDITTLDVDAVVNAANTRLRGGGGVDGAIHRAGGPAVLADCVARFPQGLATGDAGWTDAGDLPARWVIHAVGPSYTAGERDRTLLTSCYRRSLEVAGELGARTVAFPLISAGVYGWPRRDAIRAAVETIVASTAPVERATLVAFDSETREEIEASFSRWTPLRLLQGVRRLHEGGFHGARVVAGMSPSGMHWRVTVAGPEKGGVIAYSTGSGAEVAGGRVDVRTSVDDTADLVLAGLPDLSATEDDPAYVAWYSGLLHLVEEHDSLPISFADHFDPEPGWEVGWGSGLRYPHPPEARQST